MLEIVFILHIINSHGNWLELLPFHFGHAVKIPLTLMNHNFWLIIPIFGISKESSLKSAIFTSPDSSIEHESDCTYENV